MSKYADLEIALSPRNAHSYSVELRFSRPDDETEQPPERGLARFQLDKLRMQVLKPEVYGRTLRESLFADQNLQTFFEKALAITQQAEQALRLRLLIDHEVPHLHNLRWETLRNLEDNGFLATDQNLLFSRFLHSHDWSPVRLHAKGELRALMVVANPKDLAQGDHHVAGRSLAEVDVEGEWQRAKEGLAKVQTVDKLASNPAEPGRVTLNNLMGKLREKRYDVLYLVCHGGLVPRDDDDPDSPKEPHLWLEKPDGNADVVPGKELIQRIRDLYANLRPTLVVLASCQSAGQGQVPEPAKSADHQGALAALGPSLAQAGIPAVLAMQGDVRMDTVAKFMPVFFEQLTDHGQIDRAMAAARGEVRDCKDWWMPVLFMRLKTGQLFIQPEGDAAPYIPKPYEPETILIPAGPFIMGSDEKDVPEEGPQHEAELSTSYRIGKYPVTNEEYAEFIRQTGRIVAPEQGWHGQKPPADKLKHPVKGVTFFEALEYCRWLSEQTAPTYRLPTEAEWEKAARGTDGRTYPWGNDWEAGRCNEGSGDTTPVTAYPEGASPYGCFDMVGNVREWTCSLWGENRREPDPNLRYPWKNDIRNDPTAGKHLRRVYRGGSFADQRERLRCSARNSYAPDKPGPPRKRLGFRVVSE